MCHLVDPVSKAGEVSPRVTLSLRPSPNKAGQAADSGRTPAALCVAMGVTLVTQGGWAQGGGGSDDSSSTAGTQLSLVPSQSIPSYEAPLLPEGVWTHTQNPAQELSRALPKP